MPPETSTPDRQLEAPSSLYRAEFWRMGLGLVRFVPRRLCLFAGRMLANIYWLFATQRRQVVIQNLLPTLNNDLSAATATKPGELIHGFAIKVIDLWRYEAGLPIENTFGNASGWDIFERALAQKRGILLLTPHLGNWEFGGPWLTTKGITLGVITPDPGGQELHATSPRFHARVGTSRPSWLATTRLRS